MIVNRVRDQSIMPTLTIYATSAFDPSAASNEPLQLPAPGAAAAVFQPPKNALAVITDPWVLIASSTDGSAPAPLAKSGETVVQIKLREVTSQEIWRQFVEKTGATMIEASPEDVEEMERISELEKESEYNRRLEKARQDEIKREKSILERARQEADALKAD